MVFSNIESRDEYIQTATGKDLVEIARQLHAAVNRLLESNERLSEDAYNEIVHIFA